MSKEQSSFIKGLGILLIMIHNFVDILLGISCNEMKYIQHSVDVFLSNLVTTDSIWYIISFAGWIGVPLFFFLSGYGLTKKYHAPIINYRTYSKNHVVKLWELLIPVYLVYFFLYRTNIQSFITQITFTINFFSYGKNNFHIDPGIYWFFGAIFQFYLLFLVLKRLNTNRLWIICFIFLALHYFVLYFANNDTMQWVRRNFLGWGVPFILGMISARSQIKISKRINLIICILSFFSLCICLVTKFLAPLIEVSTIVFFVTLSRMMTSKWICFVGVISPSIFALHPLIRQLFYSLYFKPEYVFMLTLTYSVIVIALSWLHHRVMKYFKMILKT